MLSCGAGAKKRWEVALLHRLPAFERRHRAGCPSPTQDRPQPGCPVCQLLLQHARPGERVLSGTPGCRSAREVSLLNTVLIVEVEGVAF